MNKWSAVYYGDFLRNNVRRIRKINRYRVSEFWECAYGNFLISGGSPEKRAYVLSEKLCREMARHALPTIVLTASTELEREMVARMQAHAHGCLRVTSRNYRNYHFFYQWKSTETLRFFLHAANILNWGEDTDLPSYMSAFLDIMTGRHKTGLDSLSALARHSDFEIFQIGRSAGLSMEICKPITRYTEAGQKFRLLLQQIRRCLLPLTTERCDTRYNLSSWNLEYDTAYLVNLPLDNPQLLYVYFSMELRRLLVCTIGVRIVFSEIPLSRTEELRDAFLDSLFMAQEAGLSIPNVSGVLDERDLKQIRTMFLLLKGNLSDRDMEETARLVEGYHQAVSVAGAEKRHSAFFRAILQARQGQLRVPRKNLQNCEAVLRGAHDGEVTLVRHLL